MSSCAALQDEALLVQKLQSYVQKCRTGKNNDKLSIKQRQKKREIIKTKEKMQLLYKKCIQSSEMPDYGPADRQSE